MDTEIYRITESWICGNCWTISPAFFLVCTLCSIPRAYKPYRLCMNQCGRQTRRPDIRYCSTDCFRRHRKGRIIPCHGCGLEMYVAPSTLERRKRHYCRSDCSGRRRKISTP